MPILDTIHAKVDTIKFVKNDSVMLSDTITTPDSITLQDTVKQVIEQRFTGISHPSLPSTENWVFPLMLILFFVLVFSLWRSSNWIIEMPKNFFKSKNRSSIFSKNNILDFWSRYLLVFFAIGVLSLSAYNELFKFGIYFSVVIYIKLFAIGLFYSVIKELLFNFIGYIFINNSTLKIAKENYYDLFSVLSICLYFPIVFQLFAPIEFHNALSIFSLILIGLFYIGMIIKLFQIFSHKHVAFFYIFLYLCTLEILPFIFLYKVYNFIILGV